MVQCIPADGKRQLELQVPDTFRIKIWYHDGSGKVTIYDNGFVHPISGGNIVVHKGKKK